MSTSERARAAGLRRLPAGSFRERHPDFNSQTVEKKVRITIFLDADVLDFFKMRALQPNAAPYQTQINHELRAVMENRPKLNAREALTALSEMVEEYEARA